MGLRSGDRGHDCLCCGMRPIIAAVMAAACAVVMACIVVIDLDQRRIPRQLCWAIAACGSVLQVVACGGESLIAGVLVGLAVTVACRIATCFLGEHAIGGGDVRCMVALSLATGWGAPAGFATCFSCAAVWSLLRRWRDQEHFREPFAFAPFLAIWMIVGGSVCLV